MIWSIRSLTPLILATFCVSTAAQDVSAEAGPDRVVMVGGTTYLNGWAGYGSRPTEIARRDARPAAMNRGPAPIVLWNVRSGPGEVLFDDDSSAITTATFPSIGTYVLELIASNGPESTSSSLTVTVELPPPSEHLHPVPVSRSFKIDNLLWNARLKALIVNWIPHVYGKISDLDLPEGGINNFVEAAKKLAGQPAAEHRGDSFANAWVYNTIESMSLALMVDAGDDQEFIDAQQGMRDKLEEWIPIILAAQEPDGYLQTRFTLDPNSPEHWSPRTRTEHEGYVAGFFLEAAIAHYAMTGHSDSRLYDAAMKLAGCWYDNLGPAPKNPWYDGHQEMELALIRFGKFVNEQDGPGEGDRYIELARFLLDNRQGGGPYDQSHLPVVQQYEAVGHAVRALYSYTAIADVAMATVDPEYQSAVKSLSENIANRKYYVTGSVGSDETSQGFGPNYSLPNDSSCESCASVGELFFRNRMNLTYEDAVHADLYEETLYNALLGSLDLNGETSYDTNSLDSRSDRRAWPDHLCCVGNVPRALLALPTWMYAKSDDSIYVNLFVGSTVTIEDIAGTDVEIVQDTDYPWSGSVSFTVNPSTPASFGIRIRVPNRSVSDLYEGDPVANGITSLSVSGQARVRGTDGGYVVITGEWQAGDRIDLVLPMLAHRVKGIDEVEATSGKVALRYGPLIYNVEAVDQDITQVLPADAELTTEWREDLLGGVMVIRSTWADGSELLAIPNYARNNRDGPTAEGQRPPPTSVVWIRDR